MYVTSFLMSLRSTSSPCFTPRTSSETISEIAFILACRYQNMHAHTLNQSLSGHANQLTQGQLLATSFEWAAQHIEWCSEFSRMGFWPLRLELAHRLLRHCSGLPIGSGLPLELGNFCLTHRSAFRGFQITSAPAVLSICVRHLKRLADTQSFCVPLVE